jgi:hypothetical protein
MKLKSLTLAGLIVVILFGGISISSAMNLWQTESQKVPVKYTEGEAAGEYNPADIRGSYTFGEVSELFGVPLTDLQAAFRLPAGADPAAYQLKSLEAQFADLPVEMGTGSVRLFVAFYKGLPYVLAADEETFLFTEAVAILKQQGKLTPEQAIYLSSHTAGGQRVSEEEPVQAVPDNEAQVTATVHAPAAYTVTGRTTFQDLLDWGMPKETIEMLLGEPMPAAQILVKDFANSKGITFSELKGQIQAEVDKYK